MLASTGAGASISDSAGARGGLCRGLAVGDGVRAYF